MYDLVLDHSLILYLNVMILVVSLVLNRMLDLLMSYELDQYIYILNIKNK